MKIQGERSSENVDLASTAALPCGQEAVGNVTFLIGMSQWECHVFLSKTFIFPQKLNFNVFEMVLGLLERINQKTD